MIPRGRRPPSCPGTCSCDAVCGIAVAEGRVKAQSEAFDPLNGAARGVGRCTCPVHP